MADENLTLEQTWVLRLSADELRLVLKALGGRLLLPDVPAAKVLGDRVTAERAARYRQLVQTAEQLEAALA